MKRRKSDAVIAALLGVVGIFIALLLPRHRRYGRFRR